MDAMANENEEISKEQDITVDGYDFDVGGERTGDDSEGQGEYFK